MTHSGQSHESSRKTEEATIQDDYLDRMHALALKTQDEVCEETARIDGTPFERVERVGVASRMKCETHFQVRMVENSRLFEKANFCVSHSEGVMSRRAEEEAHTENIKGGGEFRATGFSMVFHPSNPNIPSTRIHYHMIRRDDGYWWFSGGGDITPYRLDEEAFRHYHAVHKAPCDELLGEEWYGKMKKYNDSYFHIPWRGHYRGVGGCFFDDFNERGFESARNEEKIFTQDRIFEFVEASCGVINPAYNHLVETRGERTYDESHVRFMKLLRGHYTEFDLIEDRGIKFGFSVGMPVDVFLLALPNSDWSHGWMDRYDKGTEYHELIDILRNPRDWA